MREGSLADWLTDGDDDDLPTDLPMTGPDTGPVVAAAEPQDERAPRWRLWLVAGCAWALVAAVGASLVTRGGQDDGTAAAAGEGDVPPAGAPGEQPAGSRAAPGAGATGEPAEGGGVAGAGGPAGGQAAVAAGAGSRPAGVPAAPSAQAGRREGAIAATAALTVRLTQTGHHAGDGTSRYVDLALPASVTWLGEVAVVTVDAVVLDGDRDGWQPPRAVRYIQPMRWHDGGPVPAGEAWTVPAGGDSPAPPGSEPVGDPAVVQAAGVALAAAGYEDVEVSEAARVHDHPGLLVVTVEARAPGEPERARHSVWLDAGDELRVVGTEMSDSDPHEGEQGP